MNDAIIRAGVARLKMLAYNRTPEYELPADSFLEDAVRDILRLNPDAPTEQELLIAATALRNNGRPQGAVMIERCARALGYEINPQNMS